MAWHFEGFKMYENQISIINKLIDGKIKYRDDVAYFNRATLVNIGLSDTAISFVLGKIMALPWKKRKPKQKSKTIYRAILLPLFQVKFAAYYGLCVNIVEKKSSTTVVEYKGKEFEFPNEMVFDFRIGETTILKRIEVLRKQIRSKRPTIKKQASDKFKSEADRYLNSLERHLKRHKNLNNYKFDSWILNVESYQYER